MEGLLAAWREAQAADPAGAWGAVVLAALAAALGALLAARSLSAPRAAHASAATAGADGAAAFRLDDGRAFPETRLARRLLGGGPRLRFLRGVDRGRLLDRFKPAEERERRLDAALDALEEGGAAFEMLLEDRDGALWEARGAPEDGRARLLLRRAGGARREIDALRRENAALAAERDALREALDAAPTLVWRRDREGTPVWANLPYRALSGSGADGPPRELRSGERAPHEGGGEAGGRRCVFDAVTGQRRWFEIRSLPDARGGALCYASDAAGTVAAEAALRRFVETLTGAFAHLSVGLAIFDSERRLGLFNPAFGDLMKLDPAWLASRPQIGEVLARLRENRMLPDQADFAGWRDELLALFDAPDIAAHSDVWSLPGERAIRVVARPHTQGAVAFLFEDVTETARLERRYLTEVRRRRATMDRLDEAVAAFGPSGAAEFANPAFARVWGFRPGQDDAPMRLNEALARFRALSMPAKAGAPDPWNRLAELMAREDSRTAWAQRVTLRDGRTLQARFAPMPDGSILTAFTDVTAAERVAAALRERNEALEAADEIRSALISRFSERLRRPLDMLTGCTALLAHAAQGETGAPSLGARGMSYVNSIAKAAAEIEAALLDSGDMAPPELASRQASAELTGPWPPGFADLLARAGRAAGAGGATLTPDRIDPDAARLAGDSARARRILLNLVAEAIQDAGDGGAVRVGCAMDGDRLELWTRAPLSEGGGRGASGHASRLARELAERLAEACGGELSVETVAGEGAGRGEVRARCTLPIDAVAGTAAHGAGDDEREAARLV